MRVRGALIIVSSCLVLTMMAGCAQPDPERVREACQKISKSDYSESESEAQGVFRANLPLTVLALPRVKLGADVDTSYRFLSSVTRQLTKAGYDVVPPDVVDAYAAELGLQTSAEIHNVPLEKLDQEFVADAVLYVDLEQYDSEQILVWSKAWVQAKAQLVDLDTEVTLWEGGARARKTNYDVYDDTFFLIPIPYELGSGLKHKLARRAADSVNRQMFFGHDGLLYGPLHPNAGQAPGDVKKREIYGRKGALGNLLGRYHPCAYRNADERAEAASP